MCQALSDEFGSDRDFLPDGEIQRLNQALSKDVKSADRSSGDSKNVANESGQAKSPMITRILEALPEYKLEEIESKGEEATSTDTDVIDDQGHYREDIEKHRYGFRHAKNPGIIPRIIDNLHWAELLIFRLEKQGLSKAQIIQEIEKNKPEKENESALADREILKHLIEYYEIYKLWRAVESYREIIDKEITKLTYKFKEPKGAALKKLIADTKTDIATVMVTEHGDGQQ